MIFHVGQGVHHKMDRQYRHTNGRNQLTLSVIKAFNVSKLLKVVHLSNCGWNELLLSVEQ